MFLLLYLLSMIASLKTVSEWSKYLWFLFRLFNFFKCTLWFTLSTYVVTNEIIFRSHLYYGDLNLT